MARLNENNDEFFGKKRKPNKLKGNLGNIDLEFESVNPYEFKKGMNYELNKVGIFSLREATEEDREKATEAVIKNLKDTHGAYYSYLEHYETITRNMDKKPSFKTFLKEIEGYSMKEIKDNFDNDKMKEIKLKESIRAEVRNKINELFKENIGRVTITEQFNKAEVLKMKEDLSNFLDTYGYYMAPLDKSKVFDAVGALERLLLKKGVNESREVKVTDEHRAEMLRVAQDLENIRKTHDGVEGTRLLNARMQDRDVLIKAAMVLKNLVELSNRK